MKERTLIKKIATVIGALMLLVCVAGNSTLAFAAVDDAESGACATVEVISDVTEPEVPAEDPAEDGDIDANSAVISRNSIEQARITVPSVTYSCKKSIQSCTPIVKLNGEVLRKDTDYTVEFENATGAGQAKCTITGINSYQGEVTCAYTINKAKLNATVKLSRKSYKYDGKTHKPTVKVVMKDGTVLSPSSYKVTYTRDARNLGTKTVTVKPVKNYSNSLQAKYQITTSPAALINSLDIIGKNIVKHNFHYRNSSANASTYEKALKTDRYSNCADYVTWAMQDAKVLSRGKKIWLKDTINGSGAAEIERSSLVTITHPHKTPAKCKLKVGDICGFKYGSGCHTMVYAGKNKAGKRIWYSAAGRDYRRGDLTRVTEPGYESRKICTIIRIK